MPDPIAQFAKAKYVNLETFRKTGVGVRTPVWFAQDPGLSPEIAQAQEGLPQDAGGRPTVVFYVYSEADAGKVKRIRNNPRVRVAPCTIRGQLRGAWVDARAHVCDQTEAERGQQLLRGKYGWLKISADFFGRLLGHKHTLIAIELA